MNPFRVLALTFCSLALCGLVAPVSNADARDKKTVVTLPERVEVPTGVILEPGTYVFKLMDSQANRHIVQILSEDEDQVFATILAIANERLEPPDDTVLTFYEMPGGRPQALRSWFYPGDTIGQEFAYPKDRATEIGAAVGTTVPELTEDMEGTLSQRTQTAGPAAPTESAARVEEQEVASDTELAQDQPVQDRSLNEDPLAVQIPVAPEAPTAPDQPLQERAEQSGIDTSEMLPETAAHWAALMLLGGFSLSGAAALRAIAKRRS
jgi:hypothetical protein